MSDTIFKNENKMERDILETIMLAENKSWNKEIRVAATEW